MVSPNFPMYFPFNLHRKKSFKLLDKFSMKNKVLPYGNVWTDPGLISTSIGILFIFFFDFLGWLPIGPLFIRHIQNAHRYYTFKSSSVKQSQNRCWPFKFKQKLPNNREYFKSAYTYIVIFKSMHILHICFQIFIIFSIFSRFFFF